ncbi:hypothetical protein [Moraxella sp. ZY200743]|uniref:hypothetical protein n=1 Tax=Moraxella sp. ZY200743 TaxID=2911970 RepID=UPI003D7F0E0C
MLFITDKIKTLHIKTGEVVKFTLLHETTTFTNTGENTASIQYSTDGFEWKPLASIEPQASNPLRLDKSILYVRLVSATTISITATNPILRDIASDTTQVDLPSLVTKNELDAFVKKNELNDLVIKQDISQFLTKKQILKLIPTIPQLPDLSVYALKSELDIKASIDALDELKQVLNNKADKISVDSLSRAIGLLQSSYAHLTQTKADKDNITTLTELTEQAVKTAQMATSTATLTQSQLQDKVSLKQLTDNTEHITELLDLKTDKEAFDALVETVKQKANAEWVSQNTNYILGLIQDKANKTHVDELYRHIHLVSAILGINDNEAFNVETFKEDMIDLVINKFVNSSEYKELNQISLQTKEDVTLLKSEVAEHKTFTGFVKDTDLLTQIHSLLI